MLASWSESRLLLVSGYYIAQSIHMHVTISWKTRLSSFQLIKADATANIFTFVLMRRHGVRLCVVQGISTISTSANRLIQEVLMLSSLGQQDEGRGSAKPLIVSINSCQ